MIYVKKKISVSRKSTVFHLLMQITTWITGSNWQKEWKMNRNVVFAVRCVSICVLKKRQNMQQNTGLTLYQAPYAFHVGKTWNKSMIVDYGQHLVIQIWRTGHSIGEKKVARHVC